MIVMDLARLNQVLNEDDLIYFFLELIPILDSRLDKKTLAEHLMLTYGDCTPRYNTVKSFLLASKVFFETHKREIEHLADALESIYKPYEEFNVHTERESNNKRDINDHNTNIGSVDDNGTDEHTVSADNEEFYQPRDKNIDINHRATANEYTGERGDKFHDETVSDSSGHNMSNQELALKELEVAKNNTYEIIGNWWSDRLCILVW